MKKPSKKFWILMSIIACVIISVTVVVPVVLINKKDKKNKEEYCLTAEDIENAQLFSFVRVNILGESGYSVFRYKGTNPVVTIPSTYRSLPVLAISDETFKNSKITSITLSGNITTLGSSSFYGCSKLVEVSISKSVKTIKESAFSFCALLSSLTFEDDSLLETIESSSFSYTGLTSIFIPRYVNSISYDAFNYCQATDTITVDMLNENFKSEGNCLLNKTGKLLIVGLKNSIIPQSVEVIGRNSFCGTALSEIIIPSSVTQIDQAVFLWCTSLSSVIFSGNTNITTIHETAFNYCDNLNQLSVLAPNYEKAYSACNILSANVVYSRRFVTQFTLKVDSNFVDLITSANTNNNWLYHTIVASS